MLTKSFGKLGWPVSAVGLGAWNIGNQWGDIDDATAWSTVRAAYDAGMTLFDVAESYGFPNGLSEMRVGHALTGIRHNVILVSKIGQLGPAHRRRDTQDRRRLYSYLRPRNPRPAANRLGRRNTLPQRRPRRSYNLSRGVRGVEG